MATARAKRECGPESRLALAGTAVLRYQSQTQIASASKPDDRAAILQRRQRIGMRPTKGYVPEPCSQRKCGTKARCRNG